MVMAKEAERYVPIWLSPCLQTVHDWTAEPLDTQLFGRTVHAGLASRAIWATIRRPMVRLVQSVLPS